MSLDRAMQTPTAGSRARLLLGASLVALVTAGATAPARAQSIGALMAATHQVAAAATSATPRPSSEPTTSSGMAAALLRQQQYQSQVASAQALIEQTQAAAQAAAKALNQNQGAGIADGLAPGGLVPAVTKITPLSSDPTKAGIKTWQGASLPTASASNPDDITIIQTAPRAVLSWTTFNVGQNTTLTFQQEQNGVAQTGWIVLNRVVGQLDPNTGLRNPNLAPAPSEILGSIKAVGTVLVINQNGILFGATSQVNTQALIASSLEVGRAFDIDQATGGLLTRTIAQRDSEFLDLGLLGYAETNTSSPAATFSAQDVAVGTSVAAEPNIEGAVKVQAGASLTSADTGYLMLIAPKVTNAGALISPDGEVALQSGRQITLYASSGDANSADPDVRGLVVTGVDVNSTDPTDYVDNTGLIEADRGYVSLGATGVGAALDSGFIASTTSVSRNGYVNIFAGNVQISPDAVISIAPDDNSATIPQDPTSLEAFKPSVVRIGDIAARNSTPLPGSQIDIGANSLIYAPSATISIGADPGANGPNDADFPNTSRLFIDTGAVIDAAGLANVVIPASRNSIEISPVKGNELADSPAFRNGFLNGATVYVDPRLSGVTADGVAWVGSPLIAAAAYAQQVGVSVSELMTTGGNVTLGALSYSGLASKGNAPDVIVKPGAVVDITGGWKTYQAGEVIQSYLVDASGEVVPISEANPDDTYVAVYQGFVASQPRWGITQTYIDPVLTGAKYEGQYTEGLDAGSLTVKASAIALDGQVFASAFPGPEQILNAQPGTASGAVYGDTRLLQAAPSQLPAGGYLNIQALDLTTSSNNGNTVIGQPAGSAGGGDISVVDQADYAPLASETSGLAYGQTLSIAANGTLSLPTRPESSLLPTNRLDVISLDADALSAMGLGELSLSTSGKIDVAAGANVTLAPGGVFNALAGPAANGGGAITIEGSITAQSGSINLTTGQFTGSAFAPTTALAPGDFDVVITGTLDAAGRWVNDYNAAANAITGTAWLGGGSITIAPAARVTANPGIIGTSCAAACATQTTDVSGSILIDPGALIDLAGGGYVTPTGGFSLTAKGGSLSLYEDTSYFQLGSDGFTAVAGNLPGFRAPGITLNGAPYLPLNPDAITARVDIANGTIEANGFGGGGTFTMADSSFSFGPSDPTSGAALPLNFFSQAGFASYKITTYETGFAQNTFTTTVGGVTTPIGGYNAFLATDVATVGAGQILDLTQSYFSPYLTQSQIVALQGLATGGNLYSVLTPTVPTDAWDRKAVNLTLGGLTELDVAKGGQVVGEAGGALTVGELYNQGLIRIPGGTLTQSEVLPAFYASSTTLAVTDPATVTAAQATSQPIYVLGDLPAGVGMLLAPGSVTDLSGEAIINPRAVPKGSVNPADFTTGTVVAGGTLATASAFANGASPFLTVYGANAVYGQQPVQLLSSGLTDALTATPTSRIDLAGATATFDEPSSGTSVIGGQMVTNYAPTLVWSNGGALTLGSGGTLTGAQIDAHGGASPYALGGTLTVLDPILYQNDPATPTFDAISADMINSASPVSAGFSTFVAQGELNSVGNVTLSVSRQVFVESAPVGDVSNLASASFRDAGAPDIASGGNLIINAPYIALVGSFQTLLTPPSATPGPNTVQLNAQDIDIVGAVRFDSSVGAANLTASQAVRLFGVEPWQQTFNIDPGSVSSSLIGQLAVGGNLTIKAGQVYPTTGSTFTITSAAANGAIDFQADGPTPATPYSAGGSLAVLAANIDQAGVVRVPLGALTLGANPTELAASGFATFAPATTSLTLQGGSITSVSADGLSIPYGTTTDQTEWYFAPTSGSALTAPPAGVLTLAGGKVSVLSGGTVDLSGGGDVYAYEFISGTGGTRDVLDQYNADQFSSNNGYQYPDGRQIYAIVPGPSNAAVAAFDPIYSSNYTALYSPSQAGLSVYLNASPDLAAGWYTLLPAYYAMLPGGIRVVQDTGVSTPAPNVSETFNDGTVYTSGYFGVASAGNRNALLNVFELQTQAVVLTESDIALTSGNTNFAALAAHNGTPTPQLPVDAGRLIVDPLTSLSIAGAFDTTPASGGRGSEVDISGTSLTITPGATAAPAPGTIVIADTSLEDLDASSLFLGGVRADNADGTTSLDVTSTSITVDSGVSLSGPEILMAVDGKGSSLKVDNGASIIATGAVTGESAGNYVIDGLASGARVQDAQGGFLRVSNGPERLLTRRDIDTGVHAGALTIGNSVLDGVAVELESLGELTIATNASITATNLALGAGEVSIGKGGGGLSLTSALLAELNKAKTLTIQTPNAIELAAGAYAFGDLTLDAPGFAVTKDGAATLDATSLTLANSSAALAGCGANGAPACGSGSLTLSAATIAFDSGAISTYGAGHAVTLDASGGVFVDGAASLDVGAAALTVNAPFVGDRGTGLIDATPSSLTLQTTGAVQIASATPASAFTAPAGTPGSSLTIDGASVAITGAELRATAGTLKINSTGDISISGGALLATPGYAKVFGDAADPTTVSAPGGLLSLTALDGDIAISDDSRLAIGGGEGAAGTLSLTAQKGQVYAYHGAISDVVSLGSVFSVMAPGGGASLVLDTGGAFDLSAFATGIASQFTGAVSVRSGQGDLTLAAGDSLTAASVQLTADGGAVVDSGKIDTTGVNGGDVSLYGAGGVTLTSGAMIDAEAEGYGSTDTRQASGGNVTLGTDGTGAITVDTGATINVSALNPGNRLVTLDRTNGTYYDFVAGDLGGTVTFRAPVIDMAGGGTVNVAVHGAVEGASSVVLQGFEHFDLTTLASNPDYVGVSIADGTATLNLAATAAGKINALADLNGPIVQFVQDFNVSADYRALGGLATQVNFQARPGIELDYSGNIVLASNWNLGAGVVNVAGAVAAGLMAPDPGLPGRFTIVPGDEGQIFDHYTSLIYRVGGAVDGAPGVLTIRAGGALDLQGSITDGFFQFGDQTDPAYLNQVLGGGDRSYQASLAPGCATGDCSTVQAWTPNETASNFVWIVFPGAAGLNVNSYQIPAAPYSAAANSPAALGSMPGGGGDPLGSAELFPLINGGTTPVNSWSYQLVAGADLAGVAGRPSVNPLTVTAGTNFAVTVEGQHVYGYGAVAGTVGFDDSLELQAGGVALAADQWLTAFIASNPGLQTDSYTTLQFGTAPKAARPILLQLADTFFKTDHPGAGQFVDGNRRVTTTLSTAAEFMAYVSDNFGLFASDYRAPPEMNLNTTTTYATAPTLVRTGTGSISVAASGDIDLRNGAQPTVVNSSGALVVVGAGQPSLGGTAIYTAGRIASLGMTTATDVDTGQVLAVNLGAGSAGEVNVFATDPQTTYEYGAGTGDQPQLGFAGILIANPVYAEGGGSISLSAGQDVLSRRNTLLESELGDVGLIQAPGYAQTNPWIGVGNQPWRPGVIGGDATVGYVVEARIDPQLFTEGVGTLGGGGISIRAGGDISDLSTVATDSLTTASIGGGTSLNAQVTLGGGNVNLFAGANILGGRLDVASGTANVTALGSIESAGVLLEENSPVDNTLRIRLADATVSLLAGGGVSLQGISALGVYAGADSLNADGFYSKIAGVSLVADGSVAIANSGVDVVTPTSPVTTGNTTSAVYPGSLQVVSETGDLGISTTSGLTTQASAVLLYPSPTGTLTLLADGDITQTTIAMLDSDPTLLPGAFSSFQTNGSQLIGGIPLLFPAVLPDTPDVVLRNLHNSDITHAGDPTPNRIVAGGDIVDMILSSPKQTRIDAGMDIINMAFFGQNLAASDITRVAAGRDITATTELETPVLAGNLLGEPLPAVQGDTFILGGPGALFVEAGRDLGPFLNSAVTDGYGASGSGIGPTGVLTWGNGIITVGNQWNPWLPTQSADIYTEFGVAKGENFAGLISSYLAPTAFASQPGYLFEQTTNAAGVQSPVASEQIYALTLTQWLSEIAPSLITTYDLTAGATKPPANAPALIKFIERIANGGTTTTAEALTYLPLLADQPMPLIPWLQLHESAALIAAYGSDDVTYQQAFNTFTALPALVQQEYLLKNVYFNELAQTSVPTSPSYLDYSRGYLAVNTLFPGADGYTQNSLSGGPAGAGVTVDTGNLDLRLATIETTQGGDILILGPGGRVLAGSTVSTSVQASRRVYSGAALYAGDDNISPFTAQITAIPVGYEGVITLAGGAIDSFTDQDFLLNQSRAFTVDGGSITIWSSNADVNAGQGPRTTADVTPVVVNIDADGYSQEYTAGAVSGAGIGAFAADANGFAPSVYLIAPRGTVDAGAAGVRSAGDVFIAAFQVANADNVQASGTVSGVQGPAAVNVSAQTSADSASGAAAQAAQAAANSQSSEDQRPLIFVEVLGYLSDEDDTESDDSQRRKKK